MKATEIVTDIAARSHHELYKDNSPNDYVFQKYLEYVDSGKYPYLKNVADFIIESMPELAEVRENLESHVYYSSHKYRDLQDQKHKEEMVANGWLILDLATAEKLVGQKIIAEWNGEGLFGTVNKNDKFTVKKDAENSLFLMPPRSKRRGFMINRIIQETTVFYKL